MTTSGSGRIAEVDNPLAGKVRSSLLLGSPLGNTEVKYSPGESDT